jgi:purine-binding chemotaxis protein CheW
MNTTSRPSDDGSRPVDIIAFKLHNQDFCLETTGIREIRGRGKSTPIPHAPPYVLGVMDLRGTVIPIFDLAVKLGMEPADNSERSAIVVADVNGGIAGLVVDGVSDLLTINRSHVQPLPRGAAFGRVDYAHGIITHDLGMICFLDLDRLFTGEAATYGIAA